METRILEVVEQLRWEDILAWADAPIILLILLASYILQPILDPTQGVYRKWQELFRGNKILMFPLGIGLFLSIVLEATTSEFNVNVALRRILTNSLGSAFLFQYIKRKPEGDGK